MLTILLLIGSNLFMTFAWYGHLKTLNNKPLIVAILVSWGIAFFEYTLQVPGLRLIGGRHRRRACRHLPVARLVGNQKRRLLCAFGAERSDEHGRTFRERIGSGRWGRDRR